MSSSRKEPKSLKVRILSVAPLAPVIIGLIYYGSWPFMVLMALAALVAFYEWFNMAIGSGEHERRDVFLGALYITLCFASFMALRLFHTDGAWLAVSIVLAVWASDIGAFFTGKKIGGRKLAPVLSPNKTWAGLFGAMLFAGLALGLLLSSFCYFITGCLLGAVGQAGDLLISAMKRRAGVKDTGALIPGHGGLLDRIDALLLVSPCFTAIVMIWPP